MKNSRQAFLGVLIALASIGLIIGGFSLSLAEANSTTNQVPTFTLTPTNSPTLHPIIPSVNSPTLSPTLSLTLTPTVTAALLPTLTPTWAPSLPPPPTNCPPPLGWLPYYVQVGDTLERIAAYYRSSVSEIQQANCLLTAEMIPGMVIYVPPVPTQTPLPCDRPYDWIVYFVHPGDTLYHLSQAYGVSVSDLQKANCMGSSTLLHVGQKLYVPPWGMRIPSPTFPAPVTLTATPEIGPPSETPTEASTSTPTDLPVPTATDAPTETPAEP